jgi:hypothetical protein
LQQNADDQWAPVEPQREERDGHVYMRGAPAEYLRCIAAEPLGSVDSKAFEIPADWLSVPASPLN